MELAEWRYGGLNPDRSPCSRASVRVHARQPQRISSSSPVRPDGSRTAVFVLLWIRSKRISGPLCRCASDGFQSSRYLQTVPARYFWSSALREDAGGTETPGERAPPAPLHNT